MSGEPLVVQSSTIERRRIGLGSKLVRYGFGAFVASPVLMFAYLVANDARPRYFPDDMIGIVLLACTVLGIAAFGVALLGTGLAHSSLPAAHPGEVRADDAGLVIKRGIDERRIPKERIEGGFVLPGAPPQIPRPKVVIYLRDGEVIEVEVPNGVLAHRLLGRLGIDPQHRRVTVPLGTAQRQFVAGCSTLPLALIVYAFPLGIMMVDHFGGWRSVMAYLVASAATSLAAVRLARPREVIIGADGLRVRGMLRERWIPYSAIESVEERSRALHIYLRNPKGGPSRRTLIAQGKREMMLGLAGRIAWRWRSARTEPGALSWARRSIQGTNHSRRGRRASANSFRKRVIAARR